MFFIRRRIKIIKKAISSLDISMKKCHYSRQKRRQIFRDLWKKCSIDTKVFEDFIAVD